METIFVNGIGELFPRCFSLGCLVLMTKSLLLLYFYFNRCVHAYSHTTVKLLYFFKGDRDERVCLSIFDV